MEFRPPQAGSRPLAAARESRFFTLHVSPAALDNILQETTPLLSAGLPDAQDALDEPAPSMAIRSVTAPSPKDGMAQPALAFRPDTARSPTDFGESYSEQ